jgi:biopolymer transport protein ExbB
MPGTLNSHPRGFHFRAMIVVVVTMLVCISSIATPVGPNIAVAQGDGAVDAAPAAEPEAVQPPARKSFLTWMIEALGWFWLLIFSLLSFVMVALIMMNILQVRRENLLPTDFIEVFEEKLNEKDFQGAYETARQDDSFIGRVLAAGMSRLNRGYGDALEGMQEVGEDESMALEHRLSYLALIGTVAPMLGLMGTVQGMIASFSKIAQATVSPKPADLAQGISTALFTTLIGLAIAVPAMVFYSILRNRIARFVLEVGMVSEGLMNRFASVGRKGSGGAPVPAPAAPRD